MDDFDYRDVIEFFKDTFKYIIVIIIVLIVALYVFTFQQVVGPSMSPTLNDGDVTILNKVVYKLKDPVRNEIVAIKLEAQEKFLIKRIIGLPGEAIEYKNNILYINGDGFTEKYLNNVKTNDFSIKKLGYDVIPEDYYLVLGDNRSDSMDSRDPKVGLIKKSEIVGRVKVQIWPLKSFKIVK